jgi:transposase InsO family protein
MNRMSDQFTVALMARVLEVSRSGFYAWRRRDGLGIPQQQRIVLDERVAAAFKTAKGRSGSPRLTRDLVEAGHPYDRKTVAKSMRRQGLRAKAAKRFKATTDSNHELPVAPNLLGQDFSAQRPDQKWVGDITYLWTDEGWLYLAVVLDLFSRKVIGWAMSERMKADLVCDTLRMALWRRGHPTGVLTHSDRGSQYCSAAYQALLEDHGLICSMSGKGNCYDNAVAESFFHTLKVELIHGERFASRESLRQAVFEYIEVDYNRTRRHSALGYVSPEAFEWSNVA